MTIFIVNGEEKTLEMRDAAGIDWSADFIGNTDHGMESDEEGRYIATEEDFEWWKNTLTGQEQMDETIAAYKEKFDAAEVDRVVNDWIDTDLDNQPAQVTHGLEQVFGRL